MKLFALIVLGAILSAADASSDEDTVRCAPVTPEVDSLVSYVKYLVTASDTVGVATRKVYGLQTATADSVSLVRDEVVCALAALAYDADLRPEDRVLDRQVFVIKAGSAYFVGDPVNRSSGEFEIVVVFDATFTKVLGRAAG